jgi:hypothetical protein
MSMLNVIPTGIPQADLQSIVRFVDEGKTLGEAMMFSQVTLKAIYEDFHAQQFLLTELDWSVMEDLRVMLLQALYHRLFGVVRPTAFDR